MINLFVGIISYLIFEGTLSEKTINSFEFMQIILWFNFTYIVSCLCFMVYGLITIRDADKIADIIIGILKFFKPLSIICMQLWLTYFILDNIGQKIIVSTQLSDNVIFALISYTILTIIYIFSPIKGKNVKKES